MAAVLAACGGGGGSTGGTSHGSAQSAAVRSGISYAKSRVSAAKKVPAFTLKAPSFAMEGISGKTIFSVPITSGVPYVVEVDEQAEEIAKEYGAKWIEYTNNGSPNEWIAGIDQAISQHADVILLDNSIPLSLIVPALKNAKSAGIPVVSSHSYENGQLDADPPDGPGAAAESLVSAFVTAPFWESSRLLADYAIEQSEGNANALVFTASEVSPSEGMARSFMAELHSHCPECKAKEVNVPVAEWPKKLAPLTQAALAEDPSLEYVIPLFDSMSLYAIQGITAAGKAGKIPVYSYNGTLDVLKLLQEGNGPMAMDVGESISWLAYATMDQLGRVLTGAPIVEDGNEETPLRIFDSENVEEAGSPPAADQGYGNAYLSGYEALWSGK
jgi:ribose transport system substrate-binding protein